MKVIAIMVGCVLAVAGAVVAAQPAGASCWAWGAFAPACAGAKVANGTASAAKDAGNAAKDATGVVSDGVAIGRGVTSEARASVERWQAEQEARRNAKRLPQCGPRTQGPCLIPRTTTTVVRPQAPWRLPMCAEGVPRPCLGRVGS